MVAGSGSRGQSFSLALCLPVLLIAVMACGNGASDFNVVIYVVSQSDVLWAAFRPGSTPQPLLPLSRGRSELLTLWPCQSYRLE